MKTTTKQDNGQQVQSLDDLKVDRETYRVPILVQKTDALASLDNSVRTAIVTAIDRHMIDPSIVLPHIEKITFEVEAQIEMEDTLQCIRSDTEDKLTYRRALSIAKDGKK